MDSEAPEPAVGEPTAVELALAEHEATFDHLLKLVEERGLDGFDDLGLIGFAKRFERLRNRLALIDHRVIRDGEQRRLPDHLTQPSMTAVLVGALRISHGEATRRTRAAEQLAERITMTGQPLPPCRPDLAAAQRDGDAGPEQVDIVLRALGTVDHRGFDPAAIDAGERLLAGYTATFAPAQLKDLAARVVDRIDPTAPCPRSG